MLEGAARRWLETLKDAVQEADDLTEDFELQFPRRKPEDIWFRHWGRKVRVFFSCQNSQLFLLTRGSDIKWIVERISGLVLAAPNLAFPRTNNIVATTLNHEIVEESDVVGREKEESYIVEKLLGFVQQPGISVLPIVGMGGLGKTTLANKVYRAPDVRKHFDLRMWLKVTAHGFVPLKIANAMIEAATKEGFQHYEKDTLESNLRKLIGAKRYLLVLDDVWNETSQLWDELKKLLTFGAHGSSVLVTTRSRRVASLMVSSLDQEYLLKGLSEDDCWELFRRRAFRGGEERPNLVNIGRAIVKKCDGLPLAAKAIGSLMPGMTEEDWKAVLKSEIWDREFEIPGTEFPQWLMGQSVLSNLVEVTLVECNGSDHLPQLGQLPFLEVLEIIVMKSVKKLLSCGAAFSLLRKLKLQGMHNLKEWSTMGAAGRAFPSVTEIDLTDCPKLMIMPVLPSVRVLKITNCPLLRPSQGFFGLMASLERLELESCDIVTLQLEQEDGPPMHSLKSLTIKRCQKRMFSSQSVGMWRSFRSLENLNIFECDGLVILPIDVLRCLTSLKAFVIHNCHYLVGSSNEEEGLEFGDLPELEVLNIQVCTSFPCFLPEGLKNLTGVKNMLIYSNHGLTELPEFSDSLREVTIYNCWNLISLPVGLGRLPEFERLVLLNLNKVDSLPDGSYQTLKTLMIDDCRRLLSFPPGLLNRLPELKYLEIKNSPALEELCGRGGQYWPYTEQIPTKNIGL